MRLQGVNKTHPPGRILLYPHHYSLGYVETLWYGVYSTETREGTPKGQSEIKTTRNKMEV